GDGLLRGLRGEGRSDADVVVRGRSCAQGVRADARRVPPGDDARRRSLRRPCRQLSVSGARVADQPAFDCITTGGQGCPATSVTTWPAASFSVTVSVVVVT